MTCCRKETLAEGDNRVISGSVFHGRKAMGEVLGFLGRYHQQITVLAKAGSVSFWAGSAPVCNNSPWFARSSPNSCRARNSISQRHERLRSGHRAYRHVRKGLSPGYGADVSLASLVMHDWSWPKSSAVWNWTKRTWRFARSFARARPNTVPIYGKCLPPSRRKADEAPQ